MTYQTFLQSKRISHSASGKTVEPDDIHPKLFDFQRDLTRWAIRKGRAAIFADTGLGKTLMQLEFARLVSKTQALIIAPLSVARQSVSEAEKINLSIHYVRGMEQVSDVPGQIYITNYEMLDRFNPDDFDTIVLDESSILKSLNSKTRQKLIEAFSKTPYRLCCTATPAPNDIAEIANHAEFLGIMTRAEMLATFFVHDDDGWRLKRHGREHFYRWMASWGMSVKMPSDLGYSDEGFILPELTIEPLWVKSDYCPPDQLFFTGLKGIQDRNKVRRATLDLRVAEAAKLINNNGDQWIAWCGLNDESKALAKAIPDAIEVKGSDSTESKLAAIHGFQDGKHRVLVTKVRIAGFGMNFQNANKMAFVGLGDSFEQYYQAIRRCWRFGQDKPVDVHIVLADVEDEIYRNVLRKEKEAKQMSDELIGNVQQYEREEIEDANIGKFEYEEKDVSGEGWQLMLGDSAERLKEIESESVDLSVFSPPFMSLFVYTATERDLGNSKTEREFFEHFDYIIDELLRVTKPGRNCAVHTADVAASLVNDGYIGLKDFPGMTIRAFVNKGWIYHGRVAIQKNPQAQAIRTHSKALLFNQLAKDSSWSRPAIGDYVLVFRKPGENAVPVKTDIDNDTWVQWAHPIWTGIQESDVLNYRGARGDDDERHIAPLQLETIERCIRLWTNPGETVLSPFAGIGSEGYEAIRLGREFIGCELKPEYFGVAVRNLRKAEQETKVVDIFNWQNGEEAQDAEKDATLSPPAKQEPSAEQAFKDWMGQ